jgi:secreted trypsin-like serine protease
MNRQLLVSLSFLLGTIFKSVSSVTYTCSPSAACGCSANSAVLTKIVGGEIAASQTWGWTVSLRYSSTRSHFCGGSIISASHILTAAHCTSGLTTNSLRAYVGSVSVSSYAQVRDIALIYNHPSYSSSTYLNDIAILKLSSPLNLDQVGVDLVCLPNVSSTVLASGEYPIPNINVMLRFLL